MTEWNSNMDEAPKGRAILVWDRGFPVVAAYVRVAPRTEEVRTWPWSKPETVEVRASIQGWFPVSRTGYIINAECEPSQWAAIYTPPPKE